MTTDYPIKRNNSIDTRIINIILFLYQFESFYIISQEKVLGEISPFRVVIFPLCLYYIARSGTPTRYTYKIMMFITIIFFIFCMLGATVSSSSIGTSLFSLVGSFVQFICAYKLFSKNEISRSTLLVITTWSVVQIPPFITAIITGNIGMATRYSGYFFDPNYYCAYCIPAIFASLSLLKNETSKKYKLYSIFVIIFSVSSVFITFSRGGLLSIIILMSLYLFVYYKKILVTLAILFVPLSSYLMNRAKYLSWADGADNVFDGFLYRTFTMSDDIHELSAGRSDYFQVFVDNMHSYFFIGMDLNSYMEKFNSGHFVHNGFAELCIQSGMVVGILFIVTVMSVVFIIIKRIVKNRCIPIGFMLFFSSLICLTFLSYATRYVWLCFGCLFALANKTKFIKQKYDL